MLINYVHVGIDLFKFYDVWVLGVSSDSHSFRDYDPDGSFGEPQIFLIGTHRLSSFQLQKIGEKSSQMSNRQVYILIIKL